MIQPPSVAAQGRQVGISGLKVTRDLPKGQVVISALKVTRDPSLVAKSVAIYNDPPPWDAKVSLFTVIPHPGMPKCRYLQ